MRINTRRVKFLSDKQRFWKKYQTNNLKSRNLALPKTAGSRAKVSHARHI